MLFLFTERCYHDGKLVPYTCSKRQCWPDQCCGWCRKAKTPATGIFCVQTWGFLLVLDSRYEVGWGFLLV